MSIYLIKENGFTLKKDKKQIISCRNCDKTDYANDLILFANSPTQSNPCDITWSKQPEALALTWKCFKQDGAISTLSTRPLKFVDQFTYLSTNISSTESNINICSGKAQAAIDWQGVDHMGKIKWDFFKTVAVLVLLYGWLPQNAR